MNTENRVQSFEEILDQTGFLAYTNVGVSMMPLIRQGKDIMEIKKKGPERCKKYDAVLYKVENRYILHRIIKIREHDYVIVGDHCIHKEYGITDDQILGVLIGVIRQGGRHIRVTDRDYLFYVHLWCDFYPIRAGILWCKSIARRVLGKICRKLKIIK